MFLKEWTYYKALSPYFQKGCRGQLGEKKRIIITAGEIHEKAPSSDESHDVTPK